ncbi:MAG: class I SAM-dependent methyltransferase [Candidatus Binataceae bacterium]|nr:class I SAM-dependent methyltransferase [Candidatus Binataceae bacterium]
MSRSIYEFPEIFRRVHMEQPVEITREVIFLRRVWERHLNRPVRRVLDIACGDSPHGQILLRDGIAVAGVDRSPTMIAKGRAESRNAIHIYRRPIERFRIPERLFDATFFMSETFPIMVTNADLMSHLRSVARVLRRGGIYCIDIDRHDGIELVRKRKLWRERTVRAGSVLVEIREFHRPIRWDSTLHSIYELECRIHFPAGPVLTRDIIPVRYIVPATLELIAGASGCFKLIACYADLSFTKPIERCHGRWWGILQRV